MRLDRERNARPAMEVKPGRAVRALAELLRTRTLDPFEIFDLALELAVRQFSVDHALIARRVEDRLDTFWWAHAGSGARVPVEIQQGLNLCERVLREPGEGLALGEVIPSEGGPWLRAFAGVAIYVQDRPVGTLAVLHSHPFVFSEEDLAFLRSVAGLLGRELEIEQLRCDLQAAREALAITTATIQDSALESEATGLPNARFLDVWVKGRMPHARRQKETLVLARWDGPETGFDAEALRSVAQGLRGDDLLVELSPGRFLLLLPQTPREGAQLLLDRIRKALGDPAMGATVWLPDWDDLLLQAPLRRCEQALGEGQEGPPGVRWKLPGTVVLEA